MAMHIHQSFVSTHGPRYKEITQFFFIKKAHLYTFNILNDVINYK